MSLARFPLDVQTCSLIFSSCLSSFFSLLPFKVSWILDAYGTRDLIYDWKLDEHDGVELARLKLSQFDLFYHKTSYKEIQLNDRKIVNSLSFEPTPSSYRKSFRSSIGFTYASKCRLLSPSRLHSCWFNCHSFVDILLDR